MDLGPRSWVKGTSGVSALSVFCQQDLDKEECPVTLLCHSFMSTCVTFFPVASQTAPFLPCRPHTHKRSVARLTARQGSHVACPASQAVCQLAWALAGALPGGVPAQVEECLTSAAC